MGWNEPLKFTLKELRARKNWTQIEAAREIGIAPQTYCSWENNFGMVRAKYAYKIAKIYGVKLDQITISHNDF